MPIPEFREDGWLPEGHHPTTWDEIVERFGGAPNSKRDILVSKLIRLRDGLRTNGCIGRVLLDGSFISAKASPGDFDVLLVLQREIQLMKNSNPKLEALLDAESAETLGGYTLFYTPENSLSLPVLETAWDNAKEGVPKGRVEVTL